MEIKLIQDKMSEVWVKYQAKKTAIDVDKRSATEAEMVELNSLLDQHDSFKKELESEKRNQIAQEESRKLQNEPVKPDPGSVVDSKKDQGWRSEGEFFQAVYRAAVMPHGIDKRLVEIRAISGQSESVAADGGFLVQTDMATKLFELAHEESQLYNRCDRMPLGANSNSMTLNAVKETSRVYGSQYGGVQTYWVAEGNEITGSTLRFRHVKWNAHKLAALVYATDELLADAATLENRIRVTVPKAMSFRIDDSILSGDGVGKPMGVMNSPALVTVAKTAGQTAATITAVNVMNMYVRMIPTGMKNAVWFINQDCLPQLWQMSLNLGTAAAAGALVWMPANGIAGVPYSTLGGLPVVPIEQCQTLGTSGDILLCDMTNYTIVEKGGTDVQSSMHVRFVYDEMAFRFIFRIDGQPLLDSPVTPFKGSNTQSFWIALATRA